MPRIKLSLSLLVVCILCIAVRAQDKSILHKTYLERYKAVDSLTDYAFSLKENQREKIIAGYIDWAKKNDDDELASHFALVKYRLLPNDYEEGIAEILEDIYKLDEERITPLAIEGYEILSEKAWASKQYSSAIESSLKSYNMYKTFSLKEFPKRRNFQHSLAIKYYVFKDYERSKQLLLELKNVGTGSLYEIIGGSYYNTLALAYTKLDQYDSALAAFVTIYNNELRNKNYVSAAIAAGNAGEVCNLQKDVDNAIMWLQREYEIAEKYCPGHIDGNIANSNILLAKLYLNRNQLPMAINSLNNAKKLIVYVTSYNTLKDYYNVYARIAAAQNRMYEAYTYLDSSRIYADSARVEFDKSKLIEAAYKVDRLNYELQLRELKHNRETSLFIRNAAILVIILLAVIALLFINRSRLRHMQKEEVLQKEKEKTQVELSSAAMQLEQFTKNIHEKNQLIDLFTSEIESLKSREDGNEKNELLLQLQQSTILTDEEWDKFRLLFEKVHIGFLTRLKGKYTDITPAETRYFALTKLNLSTKEMANMLGTGTTAVRNYKYRLRKKLELSDDDSFDDMIRSI